MKTIIKTLILFLCFQSIAQINSPDVIPFEGTWEASFEQNKVFRLILLGDGNAIKGDYEIEVLDSNGNVQETYRSNFNLPNSTETNGEVIYGGANNSSFAYGSIDDNTINASQGLQNRQTKWGNFSLIIQSSNPTTAEWEVKKPSGHSLSTDPQNYRIPTNIIMTKVN